MSSCPIGSYDHKHCYDESGEGNDFVCDRCTAPDVDNPPTASIVSASTGTTGTPITVQAIGTDDNDVDAIWFYHDG